MHYQKDKQNRSSQPSLQRLLLLSTIGGALLLNFGLPGQTKAEDLVIPEENLNSAPDLSVNAPVSAPVEPALEPAPQLAPESAAPESASEPAAPPESLALPPADPGPAWLDPNSVADQPSSAPTTDIGDSTTVINGAQNYNWKANTPYQAPDEVVVSDRSSGCQVSMAPGQAIAANLCGAALQRQAYDSPAPNSGPISDPGWQPSGSSWESSSTELAAAPASFDTINRKGQAIPTVRPLQKWLIKPLTGANPLKWILSNGERMLFPLPIPVDITSVFGMRTHPVLGTSRFHSGVDLGAAMGTPVLAAYSGRVSLAEVLGGYGLSILLEHDQGQQATQYAHLSELFVKPGQWVQQGTVIGLVGSTGLSTGPHLHFELQQATQNGWIAVDPTQALQIGFAQLVQALQTARLAAQPQPRTQPLPQQGGS
jgi:murein DD-endopeptidase MepM/ murein hydrolase activator NlpD